MILRRFAAAWHRLRTDRRGNVLMIFGFALVPMTFATGMAIDYSRAARLQTKLNAVTDAAALAAVTPPMLRRTMADSATAAMLSWYGQATAMSNILYDSYHTAQGSVTSTTFTADDGTLRLEITDATTTNFTRTAKVTYNVSSPNIFARLLGMTRIAIGGTSTSTGSSNPNIDFYLLLDASGSMAFPATSAGLTQMTTLTGGCAFACHSTNDAVARAADGTMKDYWGVARSYNIPLRIDEAGRAVQNLMTTASTTATNNNVTYRMSLSRFSRTGSFAYPVRDPTTNFATVGTAARAVTIEQYYTNNCPTSSFCNGDTDTATSEALTKLSTDVIRVDPGNGTNQPGDKPQAVAFLITDGMRDEFRSSGRPEVAIDQAQCNTIKARNVRIAVLYTEYLPASLSDGWSQTNVAPYLSQLEPALRSCASPGLFYKVTTDDDISAALAALFQTAVTTARLLR